MESHRRPGSTESARAGLSEGGLTRQRHGLPDFTAPLAITIVVLTAWQVASTTGLIDSLHFPAPTTIARATWKALVDGSLLADVAATTYRILWAVGIGGLLGLGFGVVMGRSERVRSAIDPFIGALHPVPKIAVLPLMMVVFGIGDLSLIVVIAAGSFFPMLISTMAGVSQIDPIHLEVARLHRAPSWLVLHRVIVPAAAPSVLAGLRLSLNTALLIAIAVEMIAANRGLGAMIWMSWTTFRIENIYVAILATVIFGLGVNFLISLITTWWIPWQRGMSQRVRKV